MREALNRLLDWFRRDRLDAELVEELRFHREQLERDARHVGATPDGAAHAARVRLGNATITREAARERWSWPWLDHLRQDMRHALRGLRRSPAFTASVVITLALGIGANAAMFGLLDRLMLRPYPFLRDPDHVHRVYGQSTNRGMVRTQSHFEYTTYLDLQRWSSSMSDFAAFFQTNRAIGVGDATNERPIAAVSASFFGFFDAPPAVGRYFAASEDQTPQGEAVAVLDHAYWQAEYGGRNVIGERVLIGNLEHTIIGVASRGFRGINEDRPPAIYVPITTFAGSQRGEDGTAYFTRYNWTWMEMLVRRKPGVSLETARRDLTGAFIRSWNAARALDDETPPVDVAKPVAIAGPLKVAAGPDPDLEARTMRWVSGVAVIVLLIACANVVNLFVGRALRRRREVALRLALGVSRGRLAAQALTESLVPALLGCGAGVL
ncbi:MAG: ABC transporter permease, partial [Cytophagaceae bacterium]|nr:ABC transporter permease [Gemmatimonadaceae bacterium]